MSRTRLEEAWHLARRLNEQFGTHAYARQGFMGDVSIVMSRNAARKILAALPPEDS